MANFRVDSLQTRFLAAQAVAREAGDLANRYLSDPDHLDVRLKGPQDFVSAADGATERLIARRLRDAFPDDAFLGEESFNVDAPIDTAMLWVVDPIDGTANFVRNSSEWCVSIGLITSGKLVLGTIYQPSTGHLYAARQGNGATKDGIPIRVSKRVSLQGSTIGIDYSVQTPAEHHFAQIRSVLERGGEYRRNGSCALSLAYLAEGRLDGFVEHHLNVWDVAAAIVLVQEAGGWTSDFLSGSGLTHGNEMIACTPAIKSEFLRALDWKTP